MHARVDVDPSLLASGGAVTDPFTASVSQVERYDDTQVAGCPRAWWFERVRWLKPEQSTAQTDGDAGHALIAAYLSTGALPGKRVKMGKMVTGAIVKGDLPKPGDDLVVEARFDGTPRPRTGEQWPDLNLAETLHLGGVPWDGFIDLAFRRGDVPEIWDHKFFSPARPDVSPDPYAYLKKPSDLIRTVQMPIYVMSQRPYWPDAKRWRIVHHCVSRQGVDSQIRGAVVEVDEVLEQAARIEGVIARMQESRRAEDQKDVPFNRRACSAYSGCPHQSICSAFKERDTVQLTAEEAALFADFETPAAASPAASPAPASSMPVDEVADLERKLAEAKAKTASGKRRMPTIDVDAEGNPIAPTASGASTLDPVPQPVASAQPTPTNAVCACGTTITPENGSCLRSGEWKHIGCKLDAPAAPAPEPKKRGRPAKTIAETVTVPPGSLTLRHADETPAAASAAPTTPLAAPAFAGERESDRAARAALEAIQSATPAPTVTQTAAPVWTGQIPDSARDALAAVFENLARLIRALP